MFECNFFNEMNSLIRIFLFCITLMGVFFANAQEIKYNTEDYNKIPVWIKMIDDTSTNYFEALKAYDVYWVGKLKPQEEEDAINEYGSKSEEKKHELYERKLSKMTPSERVEFDRMKYECKRFDNWKREVRQFVQEDGKILTYHERLEIWNRQQDEMKRIIKSDK